MIIHAISIHSGGGKVLLDHLLVEQSFGEVSHLICDQRYILPKPVNPDLQVHRFKPNLTSRWSAEILIKKISDANPNEEVLCFSNLPPAFKLKNKVILYLQNALLLPGIPLYVSSLKARLRILYEKMWLCLFWKNIDEVWVQTEWMKELISFKNKKVKLHPFLPIFPPPALATRQDYDFITVTGSTTHKRLLELLIAWGKSAPASANLLVVTDPPNKKIQKQLNSLNSKNIIVKTNVSREELFSLYQKSKSLVITSKLESFCLPIYEAHHFGLKIFLAKEDYSKNIKLPDLHFFDIKHLDFAKLKQELN